MKRVALVIGLVAMLLVATAAFAQTTTPTPTVPVSIRDLRTIATPVSVEELPEGVTVISEQISGEAPADFSFAALVADFRARSAAARQAAQAARDAALSGN